MKIREVKDITKWRKNFQQSEEEVMNSLFQDALKDSTPPISKAAELHTKVLKQGISNARQLGRDVADGVMALGLQEGFKATAGEMHQVIKDIGSARSDAETQYNQQVQEALGTSQNQLDSEENAPATNVSQEPQTHQTTDEFDSRYIWDKEAEARQLLPQIEGLVPFFKQYNISITGNWQFEELSKTLIVTIAQHFHTHKQEYPDMDDFFQSLRNKLCVWNTSRCIYQKALLSGIFLLSKIIYVKIY